MDTFTHSREAEESVIGSVFINPESYFEVARILEPIDFYIISHQYIWEVLKDFAESTRGIDLFTVADELERKGRLKEFNGGAAYLTALVARVPSSLHVVDYAVIVKDLSQRRIGMMVAETIKTNALDGAKDFSLEQEALSIIGKSRGSSRRITTHDAAQSMNDLIDNPVFFTTGVGDIDKLVGGVFPRELSILAGMQGTGKSAMKWQAAKRNADLGRKVLLCDLEMTAAQTWFRAACGDMSIDVNSVRSNKVNAATKEKLKVYARGLADRYAGKIVIYNAPMGPADILSAAILERPDLIYIDVLKNIAGKNAKENEISWYDFVLNFLRINVAQNRAIEAHVQVLHHINRSPGKEVRKPTMQDLKYAGESDADAVFLLHREKKDYDVTDEEGKAREVVPVTWITDKSRFGWTGEEDINFNLVKQCFYGMSREYREDA